jgi:hypothetical protein
MSYGTRSAAAEGHLWECWGGPLMGFITESNAIEGILLKDEDLQAHGKYYGGWLSKPTITVLDLCDFVHFIQPLADIRSREGMDVMVGSRPAPRGGPGVVGALEPLLAGAIKSCPWETHIEYEHLHPFMDGNGRSGRALWLWQMIHLSDYDMGLRFLHMFYYQTLS